MNRNISIDLESCCRIVVWKTKILLEKWVWHLERLLLMWGIQMTAALTSRQLFIVRDHLVFLLQLCLRLVNHPTVSRTDSWHSSFQFNFQPKMAYNVIEYVIYTSQWRLQPFWNCTGEDNRVETDFFRCWSCRSGFSRNKLGQHIRLLVPLRSNHKKTSGHMGHSSFHFLFVPFFDFQYYSITNHADKTTTTTKAFQSLFSFLVSQRGSLKCRLICSVFLFSIFSFMVVIFLY